MTNTNTFTTIRAEGALLPPDLLRRIADGTGLDGLTAESYHLSGQRINEAINQSWNTLQGAWANFKAAQDKLPPGDIGTSITRERWLLPLFRELDFGRLPTAQAVEIDGRSYPISHRWENVPIHLVSYQLDLDQRTRGVAGASASSPHSLVQVFLNRSDDSLWGFVSNGLKLRVLRDNASLTRQAYVEFDLQAMLDGEVYSDFVLLWLVCHQSRVENGRDCWLERWAKTAQEQGTRALDQLRDGVQTAIEALGVGFIAHSANTTLRDKLHTGDLSQQDYYRQLLRLVYRLLFLFVAEDRDLLYDPQAPEANRELYQQHYSTRRLRHMAERLKGTRHHDQFEALRLVMHILGGEDSTLTPNPSPSGRGEHREQGRTASSQRDASQGRGEQNAAYTLGLPVLGSFLWSDRAVADIIACQLANVHLLDAVRALAFTEDRSIRILRAVDYKNLGPEELGSIYESLLELHPHINLDARTFALATAGGNERKTTGSYYTPTSLINALLDSALNPVIEAAVKGENPHPPTHGDALQGRRGAAENPHPPTPSPSGRGGVNTGAIQITAGRGGVNTGAAQTSSGRGGANAGENTEAMWRLRATEAIQHIARDLRQRQTPAEQILWEALRDRRLDNLKFRRQHPMANAAYIADFLCYEARLVIEIDGGIHQYQKTDDEIRQVNIEEQGYTVLRFTNDQIFDDLENVLTQIVATARSSSPGEQSSSAALHSPRPGGEQSVSALHSPRPEGEGLGVRVLDSPESRLLALKICDPACGSGHFLIAAAHRIALRLAEIRTGEESPAPAAVLQAKRDVIGHCIYGVDINEMAVELCKVNLWMEALEPGKPLNFLDHRIQVGNSLLGTTPALMEQGIPDDAFNPIEGDDKADASRLKKLNRQERVQREKGVRQLDLFAPPPANYRALHDATLWIDRAPDETLSQVRVKERLYHKLSNDPERLKAQILADAWCAAFVWDKSSHHQPPSPSLPPQGEGSQSDSEQVSPPEGGRFRGGAFLPPMTDLQYRHLQDNPLDPRFASLVAYIEALATRYQFFHWHVAFSDVFTVPESPPRPEGEGDLGGEGLTGWEGGFDCVLGNPPWERIKIQEKEWFAQRNPEIATAPNAAARKQMIEALLESDPYLLQAFHNEQRQAEGESHFVRISGRYPLCGRGDVNTYTIFAETSRHVINAYGRVGMIVPSGIATDDTTKFFFQDLMQTHSLVSMYEFENEGFFGAGQGHMVRFVLMTLKGQLNDVDVADFIFQGKSIEDLDLTDKHFTLSAEDIALINPNSQTCPIFQTKRDAEITKRIYYRIPVLILESEPEVNPWEISFMRMFDMANDADKFKTFSELQSEGWQIAGNWFYRDQARFLPLYESKMIHQFSHRYGDFSDNKESKRPHVLPDIATEKMANSNYAVQPYYWVQENSVLDRLANKWNYSWSLGWRDVTDARASARTLIATILPYAGFGDTVLLMFPSEDVDKVIALPANLSSFIMDYCARQKVGGLHLKYHVMKQLPVIPPHTYTPELLDFIVPRVLELTYTAWDLQPFAQDVGYHGAPFIWDEERRFLLRCELDALYFHLYHISRDDVEYIMETFPIVKRKDIARTSSPSDSPRLSDSPRPEGEGLGVRVDGLGVRVDEDLGGEGYYLTKRVIVDMYDAMAQLPPMAVPAPKSPPPDSPRPEGEGLGGEGLYLVPDVSQWQTWLNPPPADARAAHPEK